MRKLIYLILGLAGVWAGYWFVGSTALESGFRSWLDQERNQGLQTNYSTLATRGFPNRFDTTITEIDVVDSNSGFGWAAPFFQVFALSYKPNHIIAVFPNEQSVQIPDQLISITSEEMRASVVFEPGTSLAFERGVVELKDLDLGSDEGWTAGLKSGLFSVRQTVGRPNSYDISLDFEKLDPPERFRQFFSSSLFLKNAMGQAELRATAGFDRPWDRFAAEGQAPVLQSINFDNVRIDWGELGLTASGMVMLDRNGIPDGRISITAKNWRKMYGAFVNAGLVAPNVKSTVESLLEILANMSGDPGSLEAPLSFQNGRMSFGPIPLGPAPRLAMP